MKQLKIFINIILFNLITFSVSAQFIHPGLSHKKSDLERMKYMVEAQIDPWYSSFQRLRNERSAQYDYRKEGDPSFTDVNNSGYRNEFERDSRAAYANALMWNITGDERHAQKAVEILNTWQNITDVSNFALEAGIAWVMIEAAEMIKHTYDGWDQSDIQKFGDMLVHPGYSNTRIPSSLSDNNDSFYWRSYQGEPFRAGNQGLSAWRTVMAIGVFLDNEIIYDRAYRHLTGQPHRSDDFAYPSGPYEITGSNGSSRYRESYNVNSRSGNQEDYGFNGVLTNYIYENGQCEESSRDQGHTVFGIGVINAMAEIGWTQGDDIYGHADSRLLKGWEYTLKYNVSFLKSYPDQQSPWEPTVASGEFLAIFDRTQRTKHLEMCPFFPNNFDRLSRGTFIDQGTFELPLAHYIGRGIMTNNEALWTERARDVFIEENGRTENFDGGTTAYGGYGGLTYRRPDLCYGDPISGFDSNGLPNYNMNVLPMTIEAENYDYSPIDGEDRTFNETTTSNRGAAYRSNEAVDIETRTGGGFNVGSIANGEWLTYTVYAPETGTYDISIDYAAVNSNSAIKFEFGGSDRTGAVTLPSTGGGQIWEKFTVASEVSLSKGVQSMKVLFSGSSGSMNLNSITITEKGSNPPPLPTPTDGTLVHITKRNATGFAIDGGLGGVNRQNVTLSAANTADEGQLWVEIDRGNGFYSYEKFGTNYSLDGNGGGATNQNIYIWQTSATNQNQQWQKQAVGDGGFKLIKRNATGFAINGGSNGREGQNITLWSSASTNQNLQWYVTPVNDAEAIRLEAIRLEAEDFDSMSGIQTENSTESGDNVGYINNGDWLRFEDVNLSGITNMDARVATRTAGGTLEVRTGSPNGTLIGSINVNNTGGFQDWRTLSTSISNTSGTQDVYLVFTGGNGYLFNVNWIEFNTDATSNKDVAGVVNTTSNIIIYPNPVVSTTTIENAANATVTVYAMDSSVLFTKTISSDSETIDLSGFASGIYFAEIKGAISLEVIKLVKN